VQVSLRYHEDLAQGQRAMFRGGCSDVGSCEYSRVMERPCVYVEEIAMPKSEEDEQTEENAWILEFQRFVQRESASIQALLEKGLDAVLQFIKRNPPYQFCFLEEMVRCLRAQTPLNGELSADERTSVGLYLLIDRLLRHLQCPCPSCRPDNGVPLGRVLLQRSIVSGKTQCKVVVIDQTGPSRRLLRKDLCRPVSEGKVDLLRYFWQPAVSTRSRLGALGVKVRPSDKGSVTRRVLNTQSKVFEDQVLTYDLASGDQLIAHSATDYFGVERIVAFELAR
jgi:hypothetical protein